MIVSSITPGVGNSNLYLASRLVAPVHVNSIILTLRRYGLLCIVCTQCLTIYNSELSDDKV
jgi:hypothetical protein